jgi:hypothetical protein
MAMPLHIGVLYDVRNEAKIRLYQRKFGEVRGASFFYNAQPLGAMQ